MLLTETVAKNAEQMDLHKVAQPGTRSSQEPTAQTCGRTFVSDASAAVRARMAAEFADAPWCSANPRSAKLNERPLSDSARPSVGDRDRREPDEGYWGAAPILAVEIGHCR